MELLTLLAGVALIVWGAELFAEHLAAASARLGVTSFALAVLLAGAEPEELATAVAATTRDVPGVAFGDVIGANAAICCVALGIGALVAPVPFGAAGRRYALLAVPAGAAAAVASWDGSVNRVEGAVLVAGYVAYVGYIWRRERRPPALGEVDELAEARAEHAAAGSPSGRAGRELALVLVGMGAIVFGAAMLVEAVRRFTDIEADQTKLSLTVIGFATAFELVVLAWSASRRGLGDTVLAACVGSFAYNATMTLGFAALVEPLGLQDATTLRAPMVAMITALVAVIMLGARSQRLSRPDGAVLVVGYAGFVAVALMA